MEITNATGVTVNKDDETGIFSQNSFDLIFGLWRLIQPVAQTRYSPLSFA